MSIFPKSPWTLIAALADPHSKQESRDLISEQLCELYSGPVYVFVERFHPACDPGDVTQDVFSYILQKDLLSKADRDRGKLRTYLIQIIKGVVSKTLQREKRIDRAIPFDLTTCKTFAAGFVGFEAENPGELFDILVARQTFRRSLDEVLRHYRERGQGEIAHELMQRCLGNGELAGEGLGVSDGNLRVQLHRFRKRLKDTFSKMVASTVQDPGMVDEEVDYLLRLLNKRGTF